MNAQRFRSEYGDHRGRKLNPIKHRTYADSPLEYHVKVHAGGQDYSALTGMAKETITYCQDVANRRRDADGKEDE